MPFSGGKARGMELLLEAIVDLTGNPALDTREARLRLAATSGSAGDVGGLGAHLVGTGRGDEAERLLRIAAERGDRTAMYNLGALLYEQEKLAEAISWLLKAYAAGYQNAARPLGTAYLNLHRISEAERWFKAAAEAGDAEGMFSVGLMALTDGRAEEAEPWLRMAAAKGNVNAMYNLGILMHKAGRSPEAERWYHKAADGGRAEAMNNLGQVHWESERFDGAEQWFRRAAEQGITQGMRNLSTALKRRGCHAEAETWLRRAQRQEASGDLDGSRRAPTREAGAGSVQIPERNRSAVGRDRGTDPPIAVTLRQLDAEAPRAARLLRILAWYAAADIPRWLILENVLSDDAVGCEEVLGQLATYGMISLDSSSISLPRLVHAAARVPESDEVSAKRVIAEAQLRAIWMLGGALKKMTGSDLDCGRLRVLELHFEEIVDATEAEEILPPVLNEAVKLIDAATALAQYRKAVMQQYRTGVETLDSLIERSTPPAADVVRAIRDIVEIDWRGYADSVEHGLILVHNLARGYVAIGDTARCAAHLNYVFDECCRFLGADHTVTLAVAANRRWHLSGVEPVQLRAERAAASTLRIGWTDKKPSKYPNLGPGH